METYTTASTPSTPATSRWRRIAFKALIVWMVLSFALGGLTKLYWGDTFFGEAYSVKFAEWGYPSWFRIVVGSAELIAAGLLLSPRWRFLAAGILVTITAGGTLTHVINQDPLGHSLSAPIHLVLAAVVAYGTNPRLVRELFSPQDR
jgi:uncharacterized membrane protein YphA (DoxX/SURF4 family)